MWRALPFVIPTFFLIKSFSDQIFFLGQNFYRVLAQLASDWHQSRERKHNPTDLYNPIFYLDLFDGLTVEEN